MVNNRYYLTVAIRLCADVSRVRAVSTPLPTTSLAPPSLEGQAGGIHEDDAEFGITEARRLAHPPSLAASLNIGTRLLSFVGDDLTLDERVAQLVAVATEQGFAHWREQVAPTGKQ